MDKFVIRTMKEDRNKLTRLSVDDQTKASTSRSLSETESVSDPVVLQLEQEPPGKEQNCSEENMIPVILNEDLRAQKMDCNHFV
jgi:hypothetical protein